MSREIIDYRYFQLQIQKGKLTKSDKKKILSLCDDDNKLKDCVLKEYGTNNTTLLYHCIKFKSLYIFQCILRQIMSRTSFDHTALNKGCRRQQSKTSNLEVTLLCKILMSLRKKTICEKQKKMYHEMMYLLILCDVDIGKKSLVEAEENTATKSRICSALELAYKLYIPHIFVALTLNKVNKRDNVFGDDDDCKLPDILTSESDHEKIQHIINKLWRGSILDEIIKCDDHTMSILSAALYYYHLLRDKQSLKRIEKTSSLTSHIGAGDTMVTYYKFLKHTKRFSKKWNGEYYANLFLLNRFWSKPHIAKLKLIELHIEYKTCKQTKGFLQFVSYLPQFYNLSCLDLTSHSNPHNLDQLHCCKLFAALKKLCEKNYTLKRIKFEGFEIRKKSSKLLAEWLKQWNGSFDAVHTIQVLSLVNVKFNNRGIQLLCGAMEYNQQLIFQDLVLDGNVFDIPGAHFICSMLQNKRISTQLQLLQMKNLKYLFFDEGDSLLKVYLLRSCLKHNFRVILSEHDSDTDDVILAANNYINKNSIDYIKSCTELTAVAIGHKHDYDTKEEDEVQIESCLRSLAPNENVWTYQMEKIEVTCKATTCATELQSNPHFEADKHNTSNWKIPKPNFSKNAKKSRKICFFKPRESNAKKFKHKREHSRSHSHMHEIHSFEETDDCIVYNSQYKYLFIQLKTMKDVTIEIDLSMFDALNVKFCYIKLYNDSSLTLSNSSLSNEIYFRNMICIQGAKELRFASKCNIKTAQMWLLDVDTVLFDAKCKISSISAWFYRCKSITNNATLSQIANCWINQGDKFENDAGSVLSNGYLYIEMEKVFNRNLIQCEILYHINAEQYKDTKTTICGDAYFYLKQNENVIEGDIFTANSMIINCKGQLTISSKQITVNNFCYIRSKQLNLINMKQMLFTTNTMTTNTTMTAANNYNAKNVRNVSEIYGFYEESLEFFESYTIANKAVLCVESSSIHISDCKILHQSRDGVIIFNKIDEMMCMNVKKLRLSSRYKVYLLNSANISLNQSLLKCDDFYMDNVKSFAVNSTQIVCNYNLNISNTNKIHFKSGIIHSRSLFVEHCDEILLNNTEIACDQEFKIVHVNHCTVRNGSKIHPRLQCIIRNVAKFDMQRGCEIVIGDNNQIIIPDKIELFDCIMDVKDVLCIEGVVRANNIYFTTNTLNISGSIQSYLGLGLQGNNSQVLMNDNYDIKSVSLVAYECVFDIKDKINVSDTASIKVRNLTMTADECDICGCMESDILYLKASKLIEFASNKLFIRNYRLFYVTLKSIVWHNQKQIIIKPNDNNVNCQINEARVLIKPDCVTITDCAIQSNGICRLFNISTVAIKSSKVLASSLEINHCNSVKYLANTTIHCRKNYSITANTLEMSVDSELYTATHSDLMSIANVHESASHCIEILENEKVPSCYIQIESIVRTAVEDELFDDELFYVSMTLSEPPSTESMYYIYECSNTDSDASVLTAIEIEQNVICYTATIDLIHFINEDNDFQNENTYTAHSFAVYTKRENPMATTAICSNTIECILPAIDDYASAAETAIIPNTIPIDTVKAILSNRNVVDIYWDYPSYLNALANMTCIECDIKYSVTYLNSGGTTTPEIVHNLPLTLPTTRIPASFRITTLLCTHDKQYESQPSDIITIDFAAASKQKQMTPDLFGAAKLSPMANTEQEQKENIDGAKSFECVMEIKERFKMYGTIKSNTVKLVTNECHIEGTVEANVLDISADESVHFGSNTFFIKTTNRFTVKLLQNCVLLMEQEMSIKPTNDITDIDGKAMVSINSSQLFVQGCKMESYGKCKIMNISHFKCMKSSEINSKQVVFDQIKCMEVVDDSEINCCGKMNVENVDKLLVCHRSRLSVTNGFCVMKLRELLLIDITSNIDCSYEHFEVECDKNIELNGKIKIGECCKFQLVANQIICNETCKIETKSSFKNEEQKDVTMIVKECIKKQFESENIVQSNYFIQFYGKSKTEFNGTLCGNNSLCIINSDEAVQVLEGAVFKLCDLGIHSKTIDFNATYDHQNGQCYLHSDVSLNISQNSLIESDKVSFFGQESMAIHGQIEAIEINIESQNQCDMECNINTDQLNINSMGLKCSKQPIQANSINIKCKDLCKMLNLNDFSFTKQLLINASTLEMSDAVIYGKNEMILNISNECNIYNSTIEVNDILKMSGSNALTLRCTKITANQLCVENIKSLKCCTDTQILYLSKFNADNIEHFEIRENGLISINYASDNFDSSAVENECCIKATNFAMDNQSKIDFASQRAEIYCSNDMNLNGTISMKHSNALNEEKTKSLKWKQFEANDLLQNVNNSLDGQHFLHLHVENQLNIYGSVIAPNSLCLLDCANEIRIEKNAKLNIGMLYIRSMRDIHFNGKIYNENGECYIGANNKLHLQRDGDICLLFLKYWSSITPQIDCTITADNLTVEQLNERLNKLNDFINNFSQLKQNDIDLQEINQKLQKTDRKYKRSMQEISDTIDKTGLNEQNIQLFLEQLNKIRDCVMKQPQSLTTMNEKLSTFITLMRREFNTELSIGAYFEFQNLMKYATALNKNGYTKLKQLECANENDVKYRQIISICEGVSGFNKRDRREIRHICLRSDSWKIYQNEKNKVMTKQMAETAPLLKDCFGAMDEAMQKIQHGTQNALLPSNGKNASLQKVAEDGLKTICKFKQNKCKQYKGEKVIKLKALTVVTGISDCCSEIIRNQKDVADSILLTKNILKLKPTQLKKAKNQSLEMRVKERVSNAVRRAWKPLVGQENKLTLMNKKQITFDDKKQSVVRIIDHSSIECVPFCYIGIISFELDRGYTFDDEKLRISIVLKKKPPKNTKYYLFERAKGKKQCLTAININKGQIYYEAEVDLIEFEEDSETEMDEYEDTGNQNGKHLIGVYRDKKKRKLISNFIELVLPEIDEFESKDVAKTVPISSIKAVKGSDDNIRVVWGCPAKINLFATCTVAYKVTATYIGKNNNKTELTDKIINKFPLIIPWPHKDMSISMQITTIISTETEIIKSKAVQIIISDQLIETEKPPKKILNIQNNQRSKPTLNKKAKAAKEEKSAQKQPVCGGSAYRASFSSGIYGSYLFTKQIASDHDSEIARKENECLDLLYDYVSSENLRAWMIEKQFNSAKICRDIKNGNTSQIKSFDAGIFKKIVKFTESKAWKIKQKELLLISSAKLWNVLDDGVVNILSSDLVTIEIAMEYFKFFGKFKASFHKLVELNPQQTAVQTATKKAKHFMRSMVAKIVTISNEKIDENRNNQILNALERVASDISDFERIQNIFHCTINELEQFAVKCIKECIKEAPNSQRFKDAQKQREKYRREYEILQKKYNEKERQLNKKYDKCIALKLKLQARKTAVEYEQKQKQNQK